MDWLVGGDRPDLAKERIYAAAADAVAARGLDRLSIDDVAARVGCSRATVYRHAGGKDAIRDTVLARAVERIADSVRESVSGLIGRDRVIAAIVNSLRAIRTEPVSAALLKGIPTTDGVNRLLIGSPRLGRAAAELCGLDGDKMAAAWIVRVVLALLFWPADDAETEEAMVRRFLAPAFGQ